jgi:hypothetical protein
MATNPGDYWAATRSASSASEGDQAVTRPPIFY